MQKKLVGMSTGAAALAKSLAGPQTSQQSYKGPSKSTLRYTPKEGKLSSTNICLQTLTAAVFAVAGKWVQLEGPWSDETGAHNVGSLNNEVRLSHKKERNH